jgi:hypothetical protein
MWKSTLPLLRADGENRRHKSRQETNMSVLLRRALFAAAFALTVIPVSADTLVIGQVAELSGQSVVAE